MPLPSRRAPRTTRAPHAGAHTHRARAPCRRSRVIAPTAMCHPCASPPPFPIDRPLSSFVGWLASRARPSSARPLASDVAAATARRRDTAHFLPRLKARTATHRPLECWDRCHPRRRFLPCLPPQHLNPQYLTAPTAPPLSHRVRRHYPCVPTPAPPAASPATPPLAHP